MHVRHPDRRQDACAHHEMPSTGVVLVIVDGMVAPLSKDLAEVFGKSRQIGPTVAQVVDLRSQVPGFLIEDSWIPAREQKIDLRYFTL